MKICTIKALAIALLAAATAPLTVAAKTGDRFESDGIFYEVLSDQELTVEVACGEYLYDEEEGETYSYTGDIVIPPTVEYDGKTYTVTAIGDFAFCMWVFCARTPAEPCHVDPFPISEGISSIYIPSTVTSIGHQAFLGCVKLTSVTIPESVTSIGGEAFYECTALTDIKLPASLTKIHDSTFYNCPSLEHIDIPASVTEIGRSAFGGCSNLKSITLPPSLTTIGPWCFSDCDGLTSIHIPASVSGISDNPFSKCHNLKEFTVDPANKTYKATDGVLYDISNLKLVAYPAAKSVKYEIPEGIIEIGSSAFYNCLDLVEIVIPQSVADLGLWAFSDCPSLNNINLPANITSISYACFSNCSNLQSISLPKGIKTIDSYAFQGCTSLKEINIPDGVTTIADNVFSDCSSLSVVNLPDALTTIGMFAFSDCSALKEVSFPASIEDFGTNSFLRCTGLTDVYCHWEKPITCNPGFPDTIYENATLHSPASSILEYLKCAPWSKFRNHAGIAGIDDIKTRDFRVKAIDGCIIVEGAEDAGTAEIRVTDLSGRTVYAGCDTHIGPLPQGLYIVTAGSATLKIRL